MSYITIDATKGVFEFAVPKTTISMKKRRRYLVKEKSRMDEAGKPIPVSPTVREWECIETADNHYKVKDLVDYQVAKRHDGFLGSPSTISYTTVEYGRELWVPVMDLVDKYEILGELD